MLLPVFTRLIGLNGWALSVSGSRRWATEGYVPGTFYDAGAYFLGVEKKLNKRHSIAFTGLGAPNGLAGSGGSQGTCHCDGRRGKSCR